LIGATFNPGSVSHSDFKRPKNTHGVIDPRMLMTIAPDDLCR
jgi:hypothetical protein